MAAATEIPVYHDPKLRPKPNIGALVLTYTILAVPYCHYSNYSTLIVSLITYRPLKRNPILMIKAPIVNPKPQNALRRESFVGGRQFEASGLGFGV